MSGFRRERGDMTYDLANIRADFPALALEPYGKPLIYLDNAASAQKPVQVLDRMRLAYETEYANVHRGLHYLANAATDAYEAAREKVRGFLGAGSVDEIIFTKNASESLNLVASTLGRHLNLGEGDEIVLSIMEHHSNIVPWHFWRERHGAVIKWAPVDEEGNFLLDEFEKLLGPKTKVVSITQMSNALGTIVPVKEVIALAHARGIPVVVDGSQAAVHLDIEAGIGLIKDRHLRVEQRHLEDFHALFLAAREADIERTLQHIRVDAERRRRATHRLHEVARRQFSLAARLTLGIHRRLEEGHGRNARNFQRILEGEKKPRRRALMRFHLEDIHAVEQDFAFGDGVILLTRDDIGERRLARTVRAHDRRDFARLHREREAVEDLLTVDFDVEVLDIKHVSVSQKFVMAGLDPVIQVTRRISGSPEKFLKKRLCPVMTKKELAPLCLRLFDLQVDRRQLTIERIDLATGGGWQLPAWQLPTEIRRERSNRIGDAGAFGFEGYDVRHLKYFPLSASAVSSFPAICRCGRENANLFRLPAAGRA